MTSPPEQILVTCPECEHVYQDWYRSVNTSLDNFDEDYLDQCESAVCPKCQRKVYFNTLRVEGNTFYLRGDWIEEDEDEET